MFSLVSGLPSTASAGADAPLFGCFTGTTPKSDSSAACLSGVRLWAFPDRPVTTSGTAEVSRFSCMKLLSVRGVFDCAGPECWLAISRQHRCCLPRLRQSRHPDSDFRSSIPGPPMPLSTLQVRPRGDPRKTRGQDGFAISFPVE